MARRVNVTLVDDIDGSDAVETVSFGLDGSAYEIDLSAENSALLRDALANFVGHARRAGRSARPAVAPSRNGRGPAQVDREQTQAVRVWARANGHTVSDRGRIPASVFEAYNAAH
ncbi:Lsr2 protein [Jatrophihabitans sp. GAS493]|uniref:histone-like nucleoid-structuring protein Lsr2 n=1 Tax=Jatrophihabitans sp. GAS493 TaxID=1907575 RepID=UPI000BB8DB72|nr:Lsr2 family protein [Jatrophihabitans sp. GAS493]SOD70539.1 Lsr2 protein [Jatrophihabitans sp. GAS493]